MTDLGKLEAAAREAEKLWKLYQIRLQILRDRVATLETKQIEEG